MSEETTKNFDGEESFETRVLSELAALRTSTESVEKRLTSVEGRVASLELKVDALGEKVDARLREARPIWEAVLTRLDIIESKVEGLALNLLDVRGEVERLKRRFPPLPPAA